MERIIPNPKSRYIDQVREVMVAAVKPHWGSQRHTALASQGKQE